VKEAANVSFVKSELSYLKFLSRTKVDIISTGSNTDIC